MKCHFFNSRQKLIFCHKLKKIKENEKIGIHPKFSDGPSASASCYEVLEQVRDSMNVAQVRDSMNVATGTSA